MGSENKRRALIGKILGMISTANDVGLKINQRKIEAEIAISNGVTRRKAKEYLELLEDAEKIIIDNGEIYLPGFLEDKEEVRDEQELSERG